MPKTSIGLIDLLERILFPLDGYPAPTPPDPTPEEVVTMRQELDERLEGFIPRESDSSYLRLLNELLIFSKHG